MVVTAITAFLEPSEKLGVDEREVSAGEPAAAMLGSGSFAVGRAVAVIAGPQ